MENLKELFSIWSTLGWTEDKEYTGTVSDVLTVCDQLDGGMELSLRWKKYLRNTSKEDRMSYNEWLLPIREEDSYTGYLLRNFKVNLHMAELDLPLSELDNLAKIFLDYHKKN